MYSEVCLELAKAGEGLTELEGGQGGREMAVLCLTLSWLGKRKESKGPHPALLLMQDLAEQVSNLRAGERTTAMFTVLKFHPEISTEVQKIKGLAGPRHFPVHRKKNQTHCSCVLIIIN